MNDLLRRLAANGHEALRDMQQFEGQEHLVSGMVLALARLGWARTDVRLARKDAAAGSPVNGRWLCCMTHQCLLPKF